MAYFVYILKCADNSYYTGITWNLKKRILEHNSGIKTSLHEKNLPTKLVFWQNFDNRIEAARREKEIKGWRREKKEKLINSLRGGVERRRGRLAQLVTRLPRKQSVRGVAGRERVLRRMISSKVEHFVYIEGVAGSI